MIHEDYLKRFLVQLLTRLFLGTLAFLVGFIITALSFILIAGVIEWFFQRYCPVGC